MAHTDQSIDTLVSISGTLASIGLALVAILVSKASIDHVEMIADDLFLFSSLGFLFVVVLGYLAQKQQGASISARLLTAASRSRWPTADTKTIAIDAQTVLPTKPHPSECPPTFSNRLR